MKYLLRLILVVFFLASYQKSYSQSFLKADTLYTMDGQKVINGAVKIKNGKIVEVGPVSDFEIPNDAVVREANVVTPGLIDAHSVVGLAGIYNQEHDQQQLETSDPIQPQLRAIDAYNPREELVSYIRSLGVTTLHTGHGPGALVSGQTMIVKTTGGTIDEALIDTTAMLAMTIGNSVSQNFKSPGTIAKGVAKLRQEFIKAQEYARKMEIEDPSKRPARDLGMEMLAKVVNGELPAMITAQKVSEIDAALRLAKEFDLKLVLDGVAESYLMLDKIKEAGVDVFIHPTMARNFGGTKNVTMQTAAKLDSMDIRFAFQSGYEGYVPKTRIVLFEAAVAAANKLGREEALKALTIDAANILGIDDRVGSLEQGKDADLVMFDGDPFEYTTHVTGVIINGELVSDKKR